jgi:ribulose-5-phosphate 4-epimerase/fuculose-1-phosphate aldolase
VPAYLTGRLNEEERMPQQSVLERPVDRARISDAEWELRVMLAAAYRLVDYFGWTEQIYGHLTARVPGPEAHFLINPWGLNYDEVTASNLVKIDVDGKIVLDNGHPVNYAGFVIHSAIHMTRGAENHVVMHTHTTAGMAVAAIREGVLPVSMFGTVFHNRIGYHDYEGASLYLDERERIVKSLGPHKALVLRNHGLLVVGKTVPECFLRLYRLERACQVQVAASAAGTLNIVTRDVADRSAADLDSYQEMQPAAEGEIEFAALMRKLDRIDDSYRR